VAIIKTPEEINILKRAAEVAQAVFAHALPLIRAGATERFIAGKMEEYAREAPGFGGLSFPPIIASGQNGAQPHAVPSGRALASGDFVTIDFGVTIEGYASDMTRTFLLGKATEKQALIYDAVLKAQLAGIAAAHAGLRCAALDRVCRSIIEDAGFGEYFVHTTGHGIGTEVHEDPRIGKESETMLEAGMAVTIEPGIYIESWGGVRIEDTVIITETGCEIITAKISKGLIALDQAALP
jgi:Xaa-Pro aminopeptidase